MMVREVLELCIGSSHPLFSAEGQGPSPAILIPAQPPAAAAAAAAPAHPVLSFSPPKGDLPPMGGILYLY